MPIARGGEILADVAESVELEAEWDPVVAKGDVSDWDIGYVGPEASVDNAGANSLMGMTYIYPPSPLNIRIPFDEPTFELFFINHYFIAADGRPQVSAVLSDLPSYSPCLAVVAFPMTPVITAATLTSVIMRRPMRNILIKAITRRGMEPLIILR